MSFTPPLILYFTNTELLSVTLMLSGLDPSVITADNPEIIVYNVLSGVAHISQIVSRLYLKYVNNKMSEK